MKDDEIIYKDNETVYCSRCHKLRYMGYTARPDSELCTCSNQNEIPTYEDTRDHQ